MHAFSYEKQIFVPIPFLQYSFFSVTRRYLGEPLNRKWEAKNGDTVSIRSCWTFGFSDLRVFLAVLRKIQTLRETGGLATAGEYYDITLVPSDVETLWDLDRGGSQRNSIRTSLERLQTMFVKIEFGDRSCEARMKEWRKKAVLMVLENDESMEKLSGEAPDTQWFSESIIARVEQKRSAPGFRLLVSKGLADMRSLTVHLTPVIGLEGDMAKMFALWIQGRRHCLMSYDELANQVFNIPSWTDVKGRNKKIRKCLHQIENIGMIRVSERIKNRNKYFYIERLPFIGEEQLPGLLDCGVEQGIDAEDCTLDEHGCFDNAGFDFLGDCCGEREEHYVLS